MKCSQSLKHIKTDEMYFSYMHSLMRPHSIQPKIELWKDIGLSSVFDIHWYDFHNQKATSSRMCQNTVIKTTHYNHYLLLCSDKTKYSQSTLKECPVIYIPKFRSSQSPIFFLDNWTVFFNICLYYYLNSVYCLYQIPYWKYWKHTTG